MKSRIYAGAIAGVITGLLSGTIMNIGLLIGLYGVPSGAILSTPLEKVIVLFVGWVVLTVILGSCFGLVFSKAYDIIPGKGMRKGLFFGLLIWFIKDIAAGAYLILVGSLGPLNLQWVAAGVNLVVLGFYMWPIYGLVLGALYKK